MAWKKNDIMNNCKTILHLTSVLSGGAGQEVLNMHNQLLQLGFDSYIIHYGRLLIDKHNQEHKINVSAYRWNRLRRFVYRVLTKNAKINEAYAPYNQTESFTCYSAKKILAVLPQKPDVIILQWASNFANTKLLHDLQKLSGAKIVIDMIDQALLTGGCHYPNDCEQYQSGCKNCPMSDSMIVKYRIRKNFEFKQHYMPKDLAVMVGSEGDARMIVKSPLYHESQIIKCFSVIDSDLFNSGDKDSARSEWGITKDKLVIFFGCTHLDEPRKGVQLMLDAANMIKRDDVVFLVAGREVPKNLPKNSIITGYLSVEQLAKAYQAADIFVCPSLADSGPLMVNQAMMCGTPVVAFPVGVSLDLVKTDETGCLVEERTSKALAKGIEYLLDKGDKERELMSTNCRKLALRLYGHKGSESTLDNIMQKIQ